MGHAPGYHASPLLDAPKARVRDGIAPWSPSARGNPSAPGFERPQVPMVVPDAFAVLLEMALQARLGRGRPVVRGELWAES